MDYNNRLYYWELEEKYGVRFNVLKKQLKGKGQDGITAAQKRKLWALGVNVTGIRYKGTACQIIKAVEEREKVVWPLTVFRVKKIVNGSATMSPEIFATASEAEYYAAKRVPPDFDVVILEYKPKNVYALVCGRNARYFTRREYAAFYQDRIGGEILCYKSP